MPERIRGRLFIWRETFNERQKVGQAVRFSGGWVKGVTRLSPERKRCCGNADPATESRWREAGALPVGPSLPRGIGPNPIAIRRALQVDPTVVNQIHPD